MYKYKRAHFYKSQIKGNKFIYLLPEKGPSDDELLDMVGKDLAEGKEKDAKQAADILEMQKGLRDRIENSEYLPEDEKKRHLEFIKIRTLSGREIKELENKVTREEKWVKSKREEYGNMVRKANYKVFAEGKNEQTNQEQDTKQEFIDEFNSLTNFADMRRYLDGLLNEFKERIDLWDGIMKIVKDRYPDKVDEYENKLKTWDRTERKRHLSAMEQLEGMDDNIFKYENLLEEEGTKEHMSEHSRQNFLNAFKKLTPNEQEFWIREFPKQLKAYEQKTQEFNQFSEDRRKKTKFKDFFEKGMTDKTKILETMKQDMVVEFEEKISQKPDEHISIQSKAFAIDSFKKHMQDVAEGKRTVEEMEQRIELIDSFVEAEKKLYQQYVQVDERLKDMPEYKNEKWVNATYEEKESLLEQIKEEEELLLEFESKLDKAVQSRVISESTMTMYLSSIGFFNPTYTLSKKKDFVYKFYENMAPRQAVVDEFMELSDTTRARSEFKEFWDRGLNGRREILKNAKNFEKGVMEKEESNSPLENIDEQEGLENVSEISEGVVSSDEGNEDEEESVIDPESIEKTKEKARTKMSQNSRQKAAKRISRLGEIHGSRDFIEKVDQTTSFEKQKARKDTAKLDDSLLKQSGGKKKINADGKVEDVIELDLDRLRSENQGDNLKDLDSKLDNAIKKRTKTGAVVADQMKTKDRSGQEKTADNLKATIKNMEEALKDDVKKEVEGENKKIEKDFEEAVDEVVTEEIKKNFLKTS